MNLKKLLALLLALVMVLSLAACGKDDGEEAADPSAAAGETADGGAASAAFDPVGTWICIREDMTLGDAVMSMSLKDMEELDETMELTVDAGGKLTMAGLTGTWTCDGNVMTLIPDSPEEFGADKGEFTIDQANDQMTQVMEMEGDTITFVYAREGSPAIEEARATSLMGDSLAGLGEGEEERTFEELTLGGSVELEVKDFYSYAYAKFTAPKDGSYAFRAESDLDSFVYLYDNEECLDYLDLVEGGAEGDNFLATIELTRNETVYLEVSINDIDGSGIVTVFAERASDTPEAPEPQDVEGAADGDMPLLALDSSVVLVCEDFFSFPHCAFEAPEDGDYTFSASSDDDISMSVYSDETCYEIIDSADEHSDATPETVTVTLTEGQTVYPEVTTYGETPADVKVTVEKALAGAAGHSDDAGDEVTGMLSYWDGDWYGWWTVSSADGYWEELDDCWWDCCARIEAYNDNTGYVELWDEDGNGAEDGYGLMIACDVSFGAGVTENGCMKSEDGMFWDYGIAHADWIVDPGASLVSGYDHMICIDGTYEDPENDGGFDYKIYLRPWGTDWADVQAADAEMMPYYYDTWYVPAVLAGMDMPDYIGSDGLEAQDTTGTVPGGLVLDGNVDLTLADNASHASVAFTVPADGQYTFRAYSLMDVVLSLYEDESLTQLINTMDGYYGDSTEMMTVTLTGGTTVWVDITTFEDNTTYNGGTVNVSVSLA